MLLIQKLKPHVKVVFIALKPCFNAMEALLFNEKEFVDIAEIQKQEQWEIEEPAAVLSVINTFQRIIIFPTYHNSLLPP